MTDISSESVEELDESKEAESAKRVEAALFIAGRFLSIQDLVSLTDVNPILLKKILSDLQDKYKESGIEVVHKESKWKMDVAEDYRDIVNRLATGSSEFTKAEQETLAIIAYKQPMKQSILVKIRGNKAYDHIKKFVEMGLIHKKKTGHTAELTLSDSFYDYFHVNKGEDLPDLTEEN
ncbi:SMC-Scp complex subunit ScpB [Candidatus Pacearchaeota archaeon]|nr:SMC-Scp complex subunit ScpB [Candidatus Pacearchaeota archaeon]